MILFSPSLYLVLKELQMFQDTFETADIAKSQLYNLREGFNKKNILFMEFSIMVRPPGYGKKEKKFDT